MLKGDVNLIKCSDMLDTKGKRYKLINKIIYAHKFRAYSISKKLIYVN